MLPGNVGVARVWMFCSFSGFPAASSTVRHPIITFQWLVILPARTQPIRLAANIRQPRQSTASRSRPAARPVSSPTVPGWRYRKQGRAVDAVPVPELQVGRLGDTLEPRGTRQASGDEALGTMDTQLAVSLITADIEDGGSMLSATWSDGRASRFPAIWLADNRPEGRQGTEGQRLVDALELP